MLRLSKFVVFLNILVFFCDNKSTFVVAKKKTPFDQLLPETTIEVQQRAVRNLITRIVGDGQTEKFHLSVRKDVPFRSFALTKNPADDALTIIGWDGISVAKGFHYYLKYYLNTDINWQNEQIIELPSSVNEWPSVSLNLTSVSAFIFYQNVCTWSYTFAWWSWSKWRRHIDWMALMGISLTIAPIQENIWNELYLQMGLSSDEIDEHFAGPAFHAWQRMGNIRGWGGPSSPTYRHMQQRLQKRIIDAQRELGISVAIPSFAGHVPRAFQRLYPNITFTPVEPWNKFPSQYCCSLFLDPNESLFHEIAQRFIRTTTAVYGSNHLYFCDPFNENKPRLSDADYLNRTAYNIYLSMQSVDDKAVWLLQGWMFVKNIFWTEKLTRAFLTAVPQNRLLILDLQSEQFPQYERTHSYFGQPFIWCMLHNFGGTLGMHGSADIVNVRFGEAARIVNSTLIEMGITPEGIHQNYAMYTLALERGWMSTEFNLNSWFSFFSDARYGVRDDRLRSYWLVLYGTVYNYHGLNRLHGQYTVTRRPGTNMSPWTWYDPEKITQAWALLLAVPITSPERCRQAYTNDLVDITRQFFQLLFDRLYVNLMASYEKRDVRHFNYVTAQLHDLLGDLEYILSTHKHFLLGNWLRSAKHMARNPAERRLYEINARNQITAWGPNGQILDYATKQWSGVVRDYYHPRWTLFLQMMDQSLRDDKPFNSRAFKLAVSNEIENPFTISIKRYPDDANGNTTLSVAQYLFDKWMMIMKSNDFVQYASLNVTRFK